MRRGVQGGLLYHFSNKSELVRGLVDGSSTYEQQLPHWDDGEPGSYTRAYIASTTHHLTAATPTGAARWSSSGASTEPEMQGPIAKRRAWMWPAPGWTVTRRAQIARLAADGRGGNAMFVNAFAIPNQQAISAALVDYAEGRDHPRNDGDVASTA